MGRKDYFSMVKLTMERFCGRGSESIGRAIAFGNGVFDQISHTLEVQFLHDALPVPAHRNGADKEEIGYFPGGLAFGHKPQDLLFPARENRFFPRDQLRQFGRG